MRKANVSEAISHLLLTYTRYKYNKTTHLHPYQIHVGTDQVDQTPYCWWSDRHHEVYWTFYIHQSGRHFNEWNMTSLYVILPSITKVHISVNILNQGVRLQFRREFIKLDSEYSGLEMNTAWTNSLYYNHLSGLGWTFCKEKNTKQTRHQLSLKHR